MLYSYLTITEVVLIELVTSVQSLSEGPRGGQIYISVLSSIQIIKRGNKNIDAERIFDKFFFFLILK